MNHSDIRKSDSRAVIKQVIENMIQETDHISSVDEILWILEHEFDIDVKRW